MNFIAICLHSLDMRDFHSHLRDTPFLDKLRRRSIFIPMGRAQGHHQKDSLCAEMTGQWTARYCDSIFTKEGYRKKGENHWLPKTVIEYLKENNYEVFTNIYYKSAAAFLGMHEIWLKNEPERIKHFYIPEKKLSLEDLLKRMKESKRFYAHLFFRKTHRPWGQPKTLQALMGKPIIRNFLKLIYYARKAVLYRSDKFEDIRRKAFSEYLIYCARKAALYRSDKFAALRRKGLADADRVVEKIYSLFKNRDDMTFIVYSNHGEVFDHFRYHQSYKLDEYGIAGTSHGPYPYEVLYANMQMWMVPNMPPKVMMGVGRLVDYAPTILDLAGIGYERMDGESMLPYFKKGVFPDRDRYAESGHCVSMVRKDGYKLISTRAPIDHHKLAVFDLKTDPYEYVNLIDTPQGQEVLAWAIEKHASLKKSVH